MTVSTLIINKGVEGLTIRDKEKMNTLSFPDKNDMIKNKKGLKKYCSYVEKKALNYMSNILTKKGETINCLVPIAASDKIINTNKVNSKNSFIKSCKVNWVAFFFLGLVSGPFLFFLSMMYLYNTDENIRGDDSVFSPFNIFGAIVVILTSFLVLVAVKRLISDIMFSYKTGYDSLISLYIQREGSETLALSNKSIYVSGYDTHKRLFEYQKYDYRDIHYVEYLNNSNGNIQILGTGFDRKELFRLDCSSNEDWETIFQTLQKNVIDANHKVYSVDNNQQGGE